VKWKRLPTGGNVEDRRGMSGGGIPIGVGGGGLALLLTVLFVVLTGNVPGGGTTGGPLDAFPPAQTTPTGSVADPDATLKDFSDRVFTDVDNTWAQFFQKAGKTYEHPKLVLFTQSTQSACGGASTAVGPHYCPSDQTVYLDLSFFRELRDRFGASGDFAHAYVIAHEVGHHVQKELGIMDKVENREDGIRLELQADCLAGVWGYTAEKRGLLDAGDTKEALDAAAAVGDDRIQQQTQGRVSPETWTHGSSEQRMKWFTRGMNKGDPAACDTFSGEI
jgi:predicted metalloprotease